MKNHLLKSAFLSVVFVLMLSVNPIFSQTASKPELSVAGFRLGDEGTSKEKLKGYSPRYDNEFSQPKYFFYNEFGTQVMTLTAQSKERPFLIVGIEVFAVGESYQKKHFQMKGVNSFVSESGFYIGEKPSATSLLFAVPNVTGAKDVVGKLGAPSSDEKEDKKVRILNYQLNEIKGLGKDVKNRDVNFNAYTAQYRFVKNRLRRFSIAIEMTPAAKSL